LTKTRHPDLDQEHPDLDQEHPDLDQEHPDLDQEHPNLDQEHPDLDQEQLAQTTRSALGINKETHSRPDIFADPTTTQQPGVLCRQAMRHGEQKSDITAARQ
jgi:hypothetical protein